MFNYSPVRSESTTSNNILLGQLRVQLGGGRRSDPRYSVMFQPCLRAIPEAMYIRDRMIPKKRKSVAEASKGKHVCRSAAEKPGSQYLRNVRAEHLSPMPRNLVSPARVRVLSQIPAHLAFGLSTTRGMDVAPGSGQTSGVRIASHVVLPCPQNLAMLPLPSAQPSIFGPILYT